VLRRKLLEGASGKTFHGIRNCAVSISFGDDLSELPPRRSDDSIVEPLLDALDACTVDGAPAVPGQPVVSVGEGQTPGGEASFVVNLAAPNSLEGEVFRRFGFDIHLQMQMQLSEIDLRSKMEDVVRGHEKPEIDHLLVTAGGPDRDGLCYP